MGLGFLKGVRGANCSPYPFFKEITSPVKVIFLWQVTSQTGEAGWGLKKLSQKGA